MIKNIKTIYIQISVILLIFLKISLVNAIDKPDFSELAEELVERGWDVTAKVGNRLYTDHRTIIKPNKGIWKGVKYSRTYTPPFNQKKNIQRLISHLN